MIRLSEDTPMAATLAVQRDRLLISSSLWMLVPREKETVARILYPCPRQICDKIFSMISMWTQQDLFVELLEYTSEEGRLWSIKTSEYGEYSNLIPPDLPELIMPHDGSWAIVTQLENFALVCGPKVFVEYFESKMNGDFASQEVELLRSLDGIFATPGRMSATVHSLLKVVQGGRSEEEISDQLRRAGYRAECDGAYT